MSVLAHAAPHPLTTWPAVIGLFITVMVLAIGAVAAQTRLMYRVQELEAREKLRDTAMDDHEESAEKRFDGIESELAKHGVELEAMNRRQNNHHEQLVAIRKAMEAGFNEQRGRLDRILERLSGKSS